MVSLTHAQLIAANVHFTFLCIISRRKHPSTYLQRLSYIKEQMWHSMTGINKYHPTTSMQHGARAQSNKLTNLMHMNKNHMQTGSGEDSVML